MKEGQKGCKYNSIPADEEEPITVARTKQQNEEEENTGIRPVGRENKGTKRERQGKTKKNKARKTAARVNNAAFALPPPLTVGFRALLCLNTLHIFVEPAPCHTMYHFLSGFVHSCISISPPPSYSFSLSLLLASTAVWRIQVLSASPLCPLVMKRSAASMNPQYQFSMIFVVYLGRLGFFFRYHSSLMFLRLSFGGSALSSQIVE